MFALLLLIPSLLLADVMVTETAPVVTPAVITDVTPAASPDSSAPISATTIATPAADAVALRLQPNLSAPVVLTLSPSEIKDPASTGPAVAGTEWFSTEREVTLVGYVDKASIQKDLDIIKGSIVWETPEKLTLLTTVTDPKFARLLDAEKGMGHVEIKEPRVLYFAKVSATSVVSEPVASTVVEAPASVVDISPTAKPLSTPTLASNVRAIEGRLQQGGVFTGRKFFLIDQNGSRICSVDKKSSIDGLTLEKYLGKVVVLVGELTERGDSLSLKVRSVRMR